MRKSIKQVVFIRVIAALMSILLFSGVTTFNLLRIKGMQEDNMQTSALLSQIQSAETALQMVRKPEQGAVRWRRIPRHG